MKIEITHHATMRLNERLQVRGRKKKVQLCERSLRNGQNVKDTNGKLQQWINSKYKSGSKDSIIFSGRTRYRLIVYMESLFIYRTFPNNKYKLLTVYPMPDYILEDSKKVENQMKDIRNIDQLIQLLEDPKLNRYMNHREELLDELVRHKKFYYPKNKHKFLGNLNQVFKNCDTYLSSNYKSQRLTNYLLDYYYTIDEYHNCIEFRYLVKFSDYMEDLLFIEDDRERFKKLFKLLRILSNHIRKKI